MTPPDCNRFEIAEFGREALAMDIRSRRLAHGLRGGGHAVWLAVLSIAAGCASVERVAAPAPAATTAAPSVAAPVPAAPAESPPAAARAVPEAPPPSTPPSDAAAKPAAATAKPPATPVTAPTPTPATQATKPAPAVPAAPAAPATQAAKAAPAAPAAPATQAAKAAAPVVATPPAAPALDLKSLETRLRETKSIGVLTKLALKNQVDDLLDQFRMFYKGTLKTTLAELRKAYDGLVLKFLALLQDADPPLAKDIAMSREAIWSILADPVKFATV